MKPFLLLASRAEDVAAEDEYNLFVKASGLPADRLHRIRMEATPLPGDLNLDDYAGVLVGGGPFNSSTPPAAKSPVQRRVERELGGLLDEIVARDFPFFGACYGVGTLGVHQGGIIDRTYAEPVSAIRVTLTEAGRRDPITAGMPAGFDAFVGHQEACRVLPPNATLLATAPACPVQMFRVGRNMYATQFHPELDVPGIITRVHVYREAGYFRPEEVPRLVAELRRAVITEPGRLLVNFVARYG